MLAKSSDFLNVTTPLAEINAPKSNNLKANFFDPVKQCINILNSFFDKFFFKISNVSFSADRVCMISGRFNSCDALICFSKHSIWSFFSEWL